MQVHYCLQTKHQSIFLSTICLIALLRTVTSFFSNHPPIYSCQQTTRTHSFPHLPLKTSVPIFPLSVAASDDVSTTNREKSLLQVKSAFLSEIETSLKDGSFVSLILRGPSQKKTKKKTTKKNQQATKTSPDPFRDEILRGRWKQILFRRICIKEKEFLQVTFKYHLATDIAKNWPLDNSNNTTTNHHSKLVEALEFLLDPTRPKVDENYIPVSEWGPILVLEDENNRHTETKLGIQSGILETTTHTLSVDLGGSSKPRLISKQSDHNNNTTILHHHDRTKQVHLDNQADFLQALGVTDAQGQPKRAMASKLRQCQKFVEIVKTLVDKSSSRTSTHDGAAAAAAAAAKDRISVLDMGCGRGYLTFSLHSYLQRKYGRVQSIGIDVRPKLVAEINAIARSLGSEFEGLTFEEGSIENLMMLDNHKHNHNQGTLPKKEVLQHRHQSSSSSSSLDILIALHACDTATDDALWCGISRQADILVVAPCCHQQIRPQLNAHLSSSSSSSSSQQQHPWRDTILRHNVYRERHAEMVTDSMRALLLELAGYQVQVFEFIGGEHTAKNCMITAVRNNNNSKALSPETIRSRIQELALGHGIRHQKLANWMGESLGEEDDPKPLLLHCRGGMPPL